MTLEVDGRLDALGDDERVMVQRRQRLREHRPHELPDGIAQRALAAGQGVPELPRHAVCAERLGTRDTGRVEHESGGPAGSELGDASERLWVSERTSELGLDNRVDVERFVTARVTDGLLALRVEESAFGYHERYRIEQDIVVGVNKFVEDTPEVADILRVDPESEHGRWPGSRRSSRTATRKWSPRVSRRSANAPRGTGNMLPVLRQALKDRCSIGEACGAMRDVFGDYKPNY